MKAILFAPIRSTKAMWQTSPAKAIGSISLALLTIAALACLLALAVPTQNGMNKIAAFYKNPKLGAPITLALSLILYSAIGSYIHYKKRPLSPPSPSRRPSGSPDVTQSNTPPAAPSPVLTPRQAPLQEVQAPPFTVPSSPVLSSAPLPQPLPIAAELTEEERMAALSEEERGKEISKLISNSGYKHRPFDEKTLKLLLNSGPISHAHLLNCIQIVILCTKPAQLALPLLEKYDSLYSSKPIPEKLLFKLFSFSYNNPTTTLLHPILFREIDETHPQQIIRMRHHIELIAPDEEIVVNPGFALIYEKQAIERALQCNDSALKIPRVTLTKINQKLQEQHYNYEELLWSAFDFALKTGKEFIWLNDFFETSTTTSADTTGLIEKNYTELAEHKNRKFLREILADNKKRSERAERELAPFILKDCVTIISQYNDVAVFKLTNLFLSPHLHSFNFVTSADIVLQNARPHSITFTEGEAILTSFLQLNGFATDVGLTFLTDLQVAMPNFEFMSNNERTRIIQTIINSLVPPIGTARPYVSSLLKDCLAKGIDEEARPIFTQQISQILESEHHANYRLAFELRQASLL